MQFSTVSAVLLSLAASVVADFSPIFSPNAFQEVPTGEPFTITWNPQPADVVNAPVSISLIGGPVQNLQVPLYTIVENIPNSAGQYVWTPDPSEYGRNFYGLVIRNLNNPDQFQYSNPFKVVAGSNAVTSEPAEPATSHPAEPVTSKPAEPTTSNVVSAIAEPTATPGHSAQVSVSGTPATIFHPAPTHSVHHNGTGIPATTLVTQGHNFPHQTRSSSWVPTQSTSAIPIGGAAATGASLALVGAGALVALVF